MQLSIIIPVYRETQRISKTLKSLLDLSIPIPFEILVVDGEPTATTLKYLKSQPDVDPGIRLIKSALGRGTQMNAGARISKGKLFFFLHADTRLDQPGMDALLQAWQHSVPARVCGAFDLTIDSPKPWFRVIEKTASFRSRLTGIPYGDQGIFISRTLFERVGGFPDVPLMEDVGLMSAVKRTKIRPMFLDYKILTSARRWETQGLAYTTLRNWIFILLYLLGVSPEKLAAWY